MRNPARPVCYGMSGGAIRVGIRKSIPATRQAWLSPECRGCVPLHRLPITACKNLRTSLRRAVYDSGFRDIAFPVLDSTIWPRVRSQTSDWFPTVDRHSGRNRSPGPASSGARVDGILGVGFFRSVGLDSSSIPKSFATRGVKFWRPT